MYDCIGDVTTHFVQAARNALDPRHQHVELGVIVCIIAHLVVAQDGLDAHALDVELRREHLPFLAKLFRQLT